MPETLSTHGHSIKINPEPVKFVLQYSGQAARLRSVANKDLSLTAFFPLHHPHGEAQKLKTIYINFSAKDVTVTSVTLHLGSTSPFTVKVEKTSSFKVDIPNAIPAKSGISVGLEFTIPEDKYIDFDSIAITTIS